MSCYVLLLFFIQVVSLILSDIVGDPLESIASGPTVPDTSTSQDALDVIKKYASLDQVGDIRSLD